MDGGEPPLSFYQAWSNCTRAQETGAAEPGGSFWFLFGPHISETLSDRARNWRERRLRGHSPHLHGHSPHLRSHSPHHLGAYVPCSNAQIYTLRTNWRISWPWALSALMGLEQPDIYLNSPPAGHKQRLSKSLHGYASKNGGIGPNGRFLLISFA